MSVATCSILGWKRIPNRETEWQDWGQKELQKQVPGNTKKVSIKDMWLKYAGMINLKVELESYTWKPENHKHGEKAISHDTWQACHHVSLSLPPWQACNGIGSHCDSPTVSTADTVVLADTMAHPLASHQTRIYSVGSMFPLHIQFSHTAPHKPW